MSDCISAVTGAKESAPASHVVGWDCSVAASDAVVAVLLSTGTNVRKLGRAEETCDAG